MFLKVFGSRGLPREPQEAQEGSQEAPKELQNLKKNDQKMDPKTDPKIRPFFGPLGTPFWAPPKIATPAKGKAETVITKSYVSAAGCWCWY